MKGFFTRLSATTTLLLLLAACIGDPFFLSPINTEPENDAGHDTRDGLDDDVSPDTGPDVDSGPDVDAGFTDIEPEEADLPCDATSLPRDSPCVIHEDYGVFVSPLGNTIANCGTREKPCGTVRRAITNALDEGKRVYVCGSAGDYAENLAIDEEMDGVVLFGGFDCYDWSYRPEAVSARIQPTMGAALVVEGLVKGLVVYDFEFTATDATDPGMSSITAIVRNSNGVVFHNVVFVSGKGGDGVDGFPGASAEDHSVSVPLGQAAVCDDVQYGVHQRFGGKWESPVACAAGGATQGGDGGDGALENYPEISSSDGQSGNPTSYVQLPVSGVGGQGGTNLGSYGKQGATGSNGNHGSNGVLASAGDITEEGYIPGLGADGTNGYPGQGGGGGGGGAVPSLSIATTLCAGGSGGAGGNGGCGGHLGKGGSGGGASVALVVWTSGITLDQCRLMSADGGKGGNGGDGGSGQQGQNGAIGGAAYSQREGGGGGSGGKGGNGGDGGSGSGGPGGPSLALVVHGKGPTEMGISTFSVGFGGLGGVGGKTPGGGDAPDGPVGASIGRFDVP